MSDPDDPRADRVEMLLDGLAEGDPLALEVERLLGEGGPVPVDERDLDRAVNNLQARFAKASAPAPARRRRWLGPVSVLAAAAALTLVAGVSWFAGQRAAAPTPEVEAPVVVADAAWGETQVELSTDSIAEVGEDTVVLVDGIVSIARTDPRQVGAHRVRVSAMDLSVEPVGTVYYVGSHDDLAAVWVREGRVRLLHETEGHLGEVAAGSWAVIQGTEAGLQVHRVPDGPFEPSESGLPASASELLADMRWMALPDGARDAILTAGDAP